jgi:endoglucanase
MPLHGLIATACALLIACGGADSAVPLPVQEEAPTAQKPASSPQREKAATSLADYPLMDTLATAPVATDAARAAALAIGRGVNFGNMFDAPNEGAWDLRAEDRFIALVGNSKPAIQSVRLPVRWSNHASADTQATIDPVFMERVVGVVDKLLARGVVVVLNMHHYRQLDGDTLDYGEAAVPDSADHALVRMRFLAMWAQIAQRFAKHDARLLLEPYNEPHGLLNRQGDGSQPWNDLVSRAVRVIRQTNPMRVLVIGPTHWNSANDLAQLALPHDPNLVLTVHSYEPFTFTHQGAEWVSPKLPTGVTCCNAAQTQTITQLLDTAQTQAKAKGYPVFVGEFGAYSQAPLASRVNYLSIMRQQMAQRGMPWTYWELAAGFGVYDPVQNQFRPEITQTLYGTASP